MDIIILKNHRPVANLTLASKLIEKVVALQLTGFIHEHGLSNIHQLTYKMFHPTETSLLKIQNNIALSMNSKRIVVLALINLSMAFDTIDHHILLDFLQTVSLFRDLPLDGQSHISLIAYKGKNSQENLICTLVSLKAQFLGPTFYPFYIS